jgi:bifunctional non-homologous end joining protein LigD
VAPMLARTGPVPVGDGWAVEVKFDGIRLQLRRDGRAVCLRSRPGRDCSEEFPELAAIEGALGSHRVLLDGELVCLGADGSPDFASLRRRLRAPADKARRNAERAPATFLAFDVLHLDGRSTRELAYERRRELLLDLALDGPGWRTPRHFVAETNRMLAATREHGLEGVVAKRLGSPYLPGARNGAWVKHKHRRSESFLVSGWSPPKRRRPESLLLARAGPDGTLEPAGTVPSCSPMAKPRTSGDSSRRWYCRQLAAVSASAGCRRRCGRSSRSTALHEGPCAPQSSAPSLRSTRPARARRPLKKSGESSHPRDPSRSKPI